MGPILLVSNSIIFVGILVGIFFLQIFLSTKENKKLGLILPGINFVISILISLIYLLNALTLDVSIFIGISIVFIAYNVPTVILISIYYTYRNKYKKKHEIDKMNIQDLD
ncbi:hypothetical protein [Terrisporobacter othiniensis]|uniref:hypothetical protein n=1 Tax=Terrisporobacter othiniensis TaxID=1577792 RepID=UPI0029318522|nr:hypothetical protein [Terrisporobacter othiniensis]